MLIGNLQELINTKKNKQVRHLFTLNDSEQIKEMVEQKSLRSRAVLAIILNIVRIVNVLFIIIFSLFLSGSSEGVFIWEREFSQRNLVLFIGGSYIVILLLLNFWLRKSKKTYERFYFVNAIADLFCFLSLAACFELGVQWQPLLLCFIITTVISVMTLNVFQCAIYAVFVFFCTCIYLLGIVKLQIGSFNDLLEQLKIIFSRMPSNWWSICLILLASAGLLFFLGFLANTSRNNGIRATINRNSYRQTRIMNEAIIAEMSNGLIVVNERAEIIAFNKKVRDVFRIKDDLLPRMLHHLSPTLIDMFRNWKDKKVQEIQNIKIFGETYTATLNPLYIDGYFPLTMINLEDIEVSYRRVRETRLASLGRLSAGIAHEIRNPLGTIQAANELIEEFAEDDENIAKLCKKISVNSARINAIIRDILSMFDNRAQEYHSINLQDFLIETVDNSKTDQDLENVPITIESFSSYDYNVHFDPGHLSQIIHNLMLNSVKHSGRGSDLEIAIKTRLSPDGRSVFLDIEDNGTGISEENAENIFEPFYSSRKGIGLGLYLVREMCLANQAQIKYLPKEGGARFRISMEVSEMENDV